MIVLAQLRRMNHTFRGQPMHIRFLWRTFCIVAAFQTVLIIVRGVLLILR